MSYNEDGLPKPIYCANGDGIIPGDLRCGWAETLNPVVTSTGLSNFDLWYRDHPVYNMRQGVILTLSTIGNDSFQFDSGAVGFHPFNTPCDATTDGHILCLPGQNSFPRLQKINSNENDGPLFSFTTELHTFFQLKGNESFTFAGDDDVFVFLNEILSVDVGGLHSQSMATIDLGNPYVRSYLGMEIGGVYALDMYHAERHTCKLRLSLGAKLTGYT